MPRVHAKRAGGGGDERVPYDPVAEEQFLLGPENRNLGCCFGTAESDRRFGSAIETDLEPALRIALGRAPGVP